MLLSPRVVLDTIGKKATIQAQIRSAMGMFLTQMMMSGAMAHDRRHLEDHRVGKRLISTHRDCANRIAMSTPATVATRSAAR